VGTASDAHAGTVADAGGHLGPTPLTTAALTEGEDEGGPCLVDRILVSIGEAEKELVFFFQPRTCSLPLQLHPHLAPALSLSSSILTSYPLSKFSLSLFLSLQACLDDPTFAAFVERVNGAWGEVVGRLEAGEEGGV